MKKLATVFAAVLAIGMISGGANRAEAKDIGLHISVPGLHLDIGPVKHGNGNGNGHWPGKSYWPGKKWPGKKWPGNGNGHGNGHGHGHWPGNGHGHGHRSGWSW